MHPGFIKEALGINMFVWEKGGGGSILCRRDAGVNTFPWGSLGLYTPVSIHLLMRGAPGRKGRTLTCG